MSGSSQLFSKSMDKFLTLPRNNQQGTDRFFSIHYKKESDIKTNEASKIE